MNSTNQNGSNGVKEKIYNRSTAMFFLILTGIISLFGDMNYEGGRSVVGQYLNILGTSAFALGLAAGLGEFIGYAFRLISGTLVDRTKKYWLFIFIGFIIQLCSLPSMAFVSGWKLAVAFLFFERLGKAIKKPAYDALISFAAKQTGSGFGFGLHEAMDQIGAFLGPALFSLLLMLGPNKTDLAGYRTGLLLLFVPAGLAVITIIITRFVFPHPQRFEIPSKTPEVSFAGFSRLYWLITIAAALLAMGITDFPLVGLHLSKSGNFPESALPLLYAGAMAIDAFAAIFIGLLYDRLGLKTLWVLFFVEIFTAPLLFLTKFVGVIIGAVVWGISVGTQESILKAFIGDIVPQEKRGRAFGLFHTLFGASWFIGSAIIGALYDKWGSIPLVVFSVLVQVAAFIVFGAAAKEHTNFKNLDQ
ncbi:MAG TPA: MFS transporter [Spirochaetales bacterium]|nr:MFS transporter [Spirochaetales bacterium]HQK34066.1 MFS transporter [Spirochaetales bacterium]